MTDTDKNLHADCLAAITAHDVSTIVTPSQLADGLVWLRNELIKVVAPFAVRKEYESKSGIARMFRISMYAVENTIKASRISYKKTSTGKTLYSTTDFEKALKAKTC